MIENNLSEIYFFVESLTLSEIFVFYSMAYMGVALIKIVAEIEIDLTGFNFSEKLLATVVIVHLLLTLSYVIQNKTLLVDEVGAKAAALLLLVMILKTFEKIKIYFLVEYFGSRLEKAAEQVLPRIQEKRRIPQKVDQGKLRALSRDKSKQYTPIFNEFILFLYITNASTIIVLKSNLYSGASIGVLSIIFVFLMYKKANQDIDKAESVHGNSIISQV